MTIELHRYDILHNTETVVSVSDGATVGTVQRGPSVGSFDVFFDTQEELLSIIDFLQHPDRYQRRGEKNVQIKRMANEDDNFPDVGDFGTPIHRNVEDKEYNPDALDVEL